MSEALRDDELGNLKLLREELRRLREIQLAPAELVNSSFEVRYKIVTYTDNTRPLQLVDVEPKRIALIVAAQGSHSAFLLPASLLGLSNGFSYGPSVPFTLTIRDFPGLVGESWYLGTENSTFTAFYIIEILDRRRR
jgi:hypothetical protein